MTDTPAHWSLTNLADELRRLPKGMPVHVPGFGMADAIESMYFHRPHGDDLALFVGPARASRLTTDRLLELLAGLTRYPDASRYSPLWVACTGGEPSFMAVTGVDVRRGVAVIKTRNMAPVQGPSLQRISDEEALRRQAEAGSRRGADVSQIGRSAQEWLLRNTPTQRAANLIRLAESRAELAGLAARRVELQATVSRCEADATELDYILGIVDGLVPEENPGTPDTAPSIGMVITKLEQFASLPVGTIITEHLLDLDVRHALQKHGLMERSWLSAGIDDEFTASELRAEGGKFTVVWLPDAG
ncbi:hypothetical protein [Arthrobacter sp. A2-55]|uniref:hypothetical protein n=1 Tax=Arthrobacter sp. A2-55 TaxID=2897337 RepID=UPI0021CD84DC|nr:hypothetical protein [Arthrobacter sp. A2-55]MCU6481317.1 hypothetical protein [Arthrobacter sp. A2-55]